MKILICLFFTIFLSFRLSAFDKNTDWSFIVLSDIHIYASGKIPTKLNKIISHVISKKPEIVFITGDHTSGNLGDSYNADQISNWYKQLDIVLKPLFDAGVIVIPTVGNHDFYEQKHRDAYLRWANKVISRYRNRLGIKTTNSLYFNFKYKDQEFFVMKFWTYVFDNVQKKWFLENTITPPKYFRFAYGHVPLKSIRGRTVESFYDQVSKVFTDREVEIYFSGHEHMHWDENIFVQHKSFRQLTTGTASGTYNHKLKKQVRDLHCVDETTCIFPASGREFKIEQRNGKSGYQVNRVNFTEVVFKGPLDYKIFSYSMDSKSQLINFYSD